MTDGIRRTDEGWEAWRNGVRVAAGLVQPGAKRRAITLAGTNNEAVEAPLTDEELAAWNADIDVEVESDELLRQAAEELGIDLSGVQSNEREAA